MRNPVPLPGPEGPAHERALWGLEAEASEIRRAWASCPIASRRRLLAATDYVDVYCQAIVYSLEFAPDVECRARGRIAGRDEYDLLVDVTEPWSMHDPQSLSRGGRSISRELSWIGVGLEFTVGGMHRGAPRGTMICVPTGWRPTPPPP
jgi:hypothetical protein